MVDGGLLRAGQDPDETKKMMKRETLKTRVKEVGEAHQVTIVLKF